MAMSSKNRPRKPGHAQATDLGGVRIANTAELRLHFRGEPISEVRLGGGFRDFASRTSEAPGSTSETTDWIPHGEGRQRHTHPVLAMRRSPHRRSALPGGHADALWVEATDAA